MSNCQLVWRKLRGRGIDRRGPQTATTFRHDEQYRDRADGRPDDVAANSGRAGAGLRLDARRRTDRRAERHDPARSDRAGGEHYGLAEQRERLAFGAGPSVPHSGGGA